MSLLFEAPDVLAYILSCLRATELARMGLVSRGCFEAQEQQIVVKTRNYSELTEKDQEGALSLSKTRLLHYLEMVKYWGEQGKLRSQDVL